MKSSYKRNLILGFGLSLLLLLISSAASFFSIRNLLESVGWVNHTYEVIDRLNHVAAGLKEAESGTRGYLLTSDKSFLVSLQQTKESVSAAIDDVKALTLDNPEQGERIPALRKAVQTRMEFLERIVEHHDPSNGITPEMLLAGKKAMDDVNVHIAGMRKSEQELMKSRTSTMETFSSFSPILIVVTSIVSFIITIAFYSRVNADFSEKNKLQESLIQKDEEVSNRIRIIQGIADKVASGDYTVRVNDEQRDALGSVASSLNKMAGSLQFSFKELSDKEWLQSGLAKLNDVIIGEKSVHTLSSNIIEFMASYSDSHAGAFYVLEGENLRFTAGYAYSASQERQQFKLGEGLVGQAVSNGALMELKEIPNNSITVVFSTGEARPAHVIAVPVYDGYNIKGAVELASLTAYPPLAIEFMRQCSKVIGTALSMSQNRRRMQELLEETQSQSEELQSQHNELENMNSELEAQTEKLQASEEELKVQQEELRQANQELEERSLMLENRNELIVQRNLEIQAKAEALAQSTKYKSEFLANMSHELRTPLNSILLLSRLMSENAEQNLTLDQVEYARVIQSSGTGLLSLIDEILDLSKIESGKMELDYSQVTVQEIVGDMQALFAPVAREKNIEFRTTVADDVPQRIETDKLRLEQIIRNLLSNALKFTSKGYVSLDITRNPGNNFMLRFKVKDTGIGIPADKRELIFEAFQQADGSTRRKYGGTGLGLSISRELAKLLGGEIVMDSEVDIGSEFSVIIPVARPTENTRMQETASAVSTPTAVQKRDPKKFIATTIPENIPDDRSDLNANDKSILIVEDDTAFARILLDYTRKRGYKGIVAVRGDEGIQLAKDLLPTAVLLDIQLPVMSGWDVMDELKKNANTRHIPVHMMSSYGGEKTESLRKGAIDFIDKPVTKDQLQDVFKKIEYVLSHHATKVLIVEENPKHAKALAYFLETFQITQEITNSIPEAIEALRQNDVNCVILDMGLPEDNSYDALENVRQTPGLELTPIIIFTGKTLSREEESRVRKYADSIVIKTAHSYRRVLDEVSLFLHLVEKKDGAEPQKPSYSKLGDLDEVLMNKTVLIADDDVRNIFSLSKAMEKYKMKVITAIDGKDAMKQLNGNPQVDIVLMDMMMPEMDGYETTTAIRKERRYKNLPVIAVTAKAMAGDRAKCIAAGASDYISKPVDIDQLLSLLRVWLYEKGV